MTIYRTGGSIGKNNTPTQSLATGMWTIDEVDLAVRASIWTLPPTPDVEYLVIGGGGSGGGTYHGGGGGAGGFQTGTGLAVTKGVTYSVTVGAGGIATTAQGNNGASSIFSSITTLGGQGGGSWYNYPTTPPSQASLGTKASGGGACYGNNVGGVGTVGQGKNGGLASAGCCQYGSGGGGGSTSAGGNGTSTTGGAGGAGTASSISGTSTTYCGGGGGSTYGYGTPGAGGSGGGTAGVGAGSALAAAANTGGGGGGGERTNGTGGAGGSGIVIIRYLSSYGPAITTTGTVTTTISGGYRIYTWTTGTGTIIF